MDEGIERLACDCERCRFEMLCVRLVKAVVECLVVCC